MADDTKMTEAEIERSAALIQSAKQMTGFACIGFEEDDLVLMERSVLAIEDEMRGRQGFAELFGRSSFNHTDQRSKAGISVVRAFIALCREARQESSNAELHVYGESIWKESTRE